MFGPRKTAIPGSNPPGLPNALNNMITTGRQSKKEPRPFETQQESLPSPQNLPSSALQNIPNLLGNLGTGNQTNS